jgi:cytochrome c553
VAGAAGLPGLPGETRQGLRRPRSRSSGNLLKRPRQRRCGHNALGYEETSREDPSSSVYLISRDVLQAVSGLPKRDRLRGYYDDKQLRRAPLRQKPSGRSKFIEWCFPATPTSGWIQSGDQLFGMESRNMKVICLPLMVQAAILAIVVTAAGYARGAEAPAISRQDLQAKIDYCKTCHGVSGQGYRGAFPMPRLAGQQPEYIENQLKAFIERRRTNLVMFNVAHVLNPSMLTALATHFKDLNPKPLGGARGAPKELVAAGKKIYEEGIPSSDVPPCASCHGPGAKGDGAFPRLAGQLHDYIIKKLVNWSKERGQDPAKPDTSAIMEPIAHSLTEPQIAAVASYLSYME